MIREITKRQFDAFCYTRQALISRVAKELAWFDAFNRKLIATVVLDYCDRDYGYIILGRDTNRVFRCIYVSPEFHSTPEMAIKDLYHKLEDYRDDGCDIYPQGDEQPHPNEIFSPRVPDEKLHPYFKVLAYEPREEAARNLIGEMAYSFIDLDGNYIKDFQTSGFDARLWELYLYVYLYNASFRLHDLHVAPDFEIEKFGETLLIEAVTVNPSQSNSPRKDPSPPQTEEEIRELRRDYLPIKYGSALFSKLRKQYWNLQHVRDRPLILAIHDFHMPGSMVWSRTGLQDYLYGIRYFTETDRAGNTILRRENISSHTWEGKEIPSNFFGLPDAEHISAVLFSNAATITKFNRMGKLAGLGSEDVTLIRQGFLYDPNPHSITPIPFSKNVDDPDYEESWSDSLVMFHNPNALHPVNPYLFDDISHIINDEEHGYIGKIKEYDVISSITITLVTTKEDDKNS